MTCEVCGQESVRWALYPPVGFKQILICDDCLEKEKEKVNLFVGSCPHCGQRIWSNDRIEKNKINEKEDIYECLACKRHVAKKDIVPF